MTNRSPVSSTQNIFFDSEQVDDSDLSTEQNHNNAAQTSLINNHIGAGVLPEVLNQYVLFDSSLESGLLDGIAVDAQSQPSDTNLGNQLEIALTGSKASGKKAVKVAVIGLDFESNLQYETFIFKANETQISKKHFANILTILFNDLVGVAAQSFNLGGRVLIREAKPFTLSRDTIMASQDVEPNLFWRDFFISGGGTLATLLASALPLYNVDNLDINTGFKENKILEKDDVTSQIGQKFKASTSNIQKVSLLLSVQNTDEGDEDELDWNGDLVISILPLQSTIQCPTDITPDLAIEFSPSNIPLAQVSVNYNTLQALGTTLDGTPQPVDFIFSNTLVASLGGNITIGNYYAITIRRSGSANKCDILVASGSSIGENSRVTQFAGTVWVDLPEDDLWFRVYTDAAKVSDGQAYDAGHGVIIPKIALDATSGLQVDYSLDNIEFGGNELYTGVVSATIEKSVPVQDQRTGNPVYSRQQFIPSVQLLNPIDYANLSEATEPLKIGIVTDKNLKALDAGSETLTANLHAWTFIKNEIVIKVIDDDTDPRYDETVNSLVSNLVNGDFTNAKLIPNSAFPSIYYRVAKAELCSMIYGDVNGDGVVDDDDLTLYSDYLGIDLNVAPPILSAITTDGYITTVTNGYSVYNNDFVNAFGLTYQLVDPVDGYVAATGTDGILVVNPNDGSLGTFQSSSLNFSEVTNLINLKLVIIGDTNLGNNGSFTISSTNTASDFIINIKKVVLTSDIISQILRTDIDCNFEITSNDGYYIQSYIDKSPPFPATTSPANRVGTRFSVIKIKLDPFTFMDVSTNTGRNDDYSATTVNRSTVLHKTQDVFTDNAAFASYDFEAVEIEFNLVKQLSWDEHLVAVSGNARFIPTVFTSQTGYTTNSCSLDGVECDVYPVTPEVDPGLIDSYIPNNLIIGDGGELKRSDGDFYKVDFEVGTIVLEIPDGLFGIERTINIFEDFVADYNNTGVTRLGFVAMRFADCSLVSSSALLDGQVRFSVSVQSFSPNTNGTDDDGYSGAIVDGHIGVAMDYETGLMSLNFTNLYEDAIFSTLNTKVQISVYLKKGGFNNTPLFVDSSKVQNILELISVFSGAGGQTESPVSTSGTLDLTGTTSADGYVATLYDSLGNQFTLQNDTAYALKITTLATTVGTDARAMFINDLLMHCTTGIAAIDNDNITLAVLNGETWSIAFTVSGLNNELIATFTATAPDIVKVKASVQWVELEGEV